jgi:hypothetical protein
MTFFIIIAALVFLIVMYVYLNYKFNRKLEMAKLMLDRATLMKMYPHYSPEIISAELTKNNEALVHQFDRYNKQDLSMISKILGVDSMLFLDIAKAGKNNPDKIKLWKDNATNFADLLNEIDDRKWSKNAGEKLFHEYQDLIIAGMNSKDLSEFNQIRDQASKIGLFIA